jgi:hypothetical protein
MAPGQIPGAGASASGGDASDAGGSSDAGPADAASGDISSDGDDAASGDGSVDVGETADAAADDGTVDTVSEDVATDVPEDTVADAPTEDAADDLPNDEDLADMEVSDAGDLEDAGADALDDATDGDLTDADADLDDADDTSPTDVLTDPDADEPDLLDEDQDADVETEPEVGDPPPAPTGVTATDGTSVSAVTASWNAAADATSYRVLRDDVEIAQGIAGTTYDDTGAEAQPASADGLGLSASDGDYSDVVRLSWSVPDVPHGTIHEYRVVAENEWGTSTPSAFDYGHLAPLPVTSYDLEIDGGAWFDVGNVTTVDDTGAPPGTLDSAGTASAGDGTEPCFVPLEVTGVTVSVGADVSYRVRAVNAAGPGAASATEVGYRDAPQLSYQWQRSTDADGTAFEDIDGATAATHEDRGGPFGAVARHYRCVVSDGAGTSLVSGSDTGFREVLKLFAGNGGERSDQFGRGVDVSDDTFIVGTRYGTQTLGGDNVGSAYLYRYQASGGLDDVAGLFASDGADNDRFGETVAIDGEWAIVGAYFDEDLGASSGSAYFFHNDPVLGWVEETKLTASDGSADDRFGSAVDLSGNRAVVGARYHNHPGRPSGGAYVFELDPLSGWEEVDELMPTSRNDLDSFGDSVAISGDWVIVGAPGDDDAGSSAGAAYVFEFDSTDGWVERDKFLLSPAEPYARFGEAVDINGNLAAVAGDGEVGPAFLYEFVTGVGWNELQALETPLAGAGDLYGHSIAIASGAVVVSAPYDSDVVYRSGSVHVFSLDGDTWSPDGEIHAPDANAGAEDRFGYAVGLSDRWLVVGAPYDGDIADFAGSAYLVCLDR